MHHDRNVNGERFEDLSSNFLKLRYHNKDNRKDCKRKYILEALFKRFPTCSRFLTLKQVGNRVNGAILDMCCNFSRFSKVCSLLLWHDTLKMGQEKPPASHVKVKKIKDVYAVR